VKVPVKRRVPKQKTQEFPAIVLALVNGDSIQQTPENRSALLKIMYFDYHLYAHEIRDKAAVVFRQWDAADVSVDVTPGKRRQ
jgi:hypothetical protein